MQEDGGEWNSSSDLYDGPVFFPALLLNAGHHNDSYKYALESDQILCHVWVILGTLGVLGVEYWSGA